MAFEKKLLKDIITTPVEIFTALDFPIRIAQDDGDNITSFRIVGLSKTAFICARIAYKDTEDDGWISPFVPYEESFELPFDEVDDTYILASEPTPKQIKWLRYFEDRYSFSPLEDMTGYEAWHVINKHVQKVQEQRKYAAEHPRYIEEEDYNSIYEGYDVPNM